MATRKSAADAVVKTYKVITPLNLGEGKRLEPGETFEANDNEVAELVEAGAIAEA